MWTIDPINGTKGFLRGEQYAVCLALIVDSQNPEKWGRIFVAVRGHSAEQVNSF
ncbi:hypothetical protein M378DRAFT_18390 [Amanita muscaria Koide BX008]|uniref:Uncharacterized protein n=1 Tax=Amanita muscaria (strain Koide BX008) TaxID=946122 RepID=A0A0C2SLZ9_AMAMK|nr:hypothetical protein M378DRAFT_18390 [Amanita muscaria Koide BX008]